MFSPRHLPIILSVSQHSIENKAVTRDSTTT